jgi:hypothetical protein
LRGLRRLCDLGGDKCFHRNCQFSSPFISAR